MAAVDLSLSGLASGFDWKTLVEQLAQAERSPQTALRNQQNTLYQRNNAYGSIKTEMGVLQTRVATLNDASIYDSRTSSTSDATVAGATAGTGTPNGSYVFNITQLATAAKRQGAANAGKSLSATRDVSAVTLANAGFSTAVTAGTMTVNGKQVTLDAADTLQQVFDKIATATGNTVAGSYDPTNDKISLTSTSGPVVLGSATDTSNFLQTAKLYNNGTGSVTSANALGGVKLTGTLTDANLATTLTDGGSGAGEFKINGVSISFNTTTESMSAVMTRINNSTAGVTASYDSVNDRFVLTNKGTGDMDISLSDVTGNFLAATGLSGSTLARGKNATYTINGGDPLVSQSNTISDASSGITGLSISALKEGQTTVNVGNDTTKIKAAVTDFIAAYNSVQSLIDSQTASTTDAKGVVTAGILAADGDANDISTTLRRTVFSQVSGLSGTLKHLADLGIQTSGNDNSLTLSDSTKLDDALTNNLTSVQELFSDSTHGIATNLASYLDHAIGDSGTIVSKQDGLTKQVANIDTQVADMEKLVQADRTRMLAAFTAMETAQQQTNQQLAYLTKNFP